jgi:hypothetical protein
VLAKLMGGSADGYEFVLQPGKPPPATVDVSTVRYFVAFVNPVLKVVYYSNDPRGVPNVEHFEGGPT